MSDRSKNLLATVAVLGIAAIASSRGLQAPPTSSAPVPQQVAAASPLVLASLDR